MADQGPSTTRYRFACFELSPARRVLTSDGRDVRLIPRYFDLLVLLVEQRHRAVHRQEIFDRVWSDVIVSDGALTQAIRTLRRALGDDDLREPRFIRTVSRHGYQFICDGVRIEPDLEVAAPARDDSRAHARDDDPFDEAIDRLLARGQWAQASDEDRRDAAEQLHALGTEDALRRLDGLPGHTEARALLRDARWDVPGAGEVPILGTRQPLAAAWALVRFRLRRAARLAGTRWIFASAGGLTAGIVAGAIGGLALLAAQQGRAGPSIVLALAIVGAVAGALGAGGVGAGLAGAEALARSRRGLALAGCGALGGAVAGVTGRLAARAVLASVFGQDVAGIGGGLEGLVLGAAAGLGYGAATGPLAGGGLATPHGAARLRAALLTGSACAAAGLVLALGGRHLVAASLDALAERFAGSAAGLGPLARLFGEQSLRPLTRTLVSGFEGLLFGIGLAYGLTHRPPVRNGDSHRRAT
jgi:DNA-binding winged helix-turn-helix (wHTH) protein